MDTRRLLPQGLLLSALVTASAQAEFVELDWQSAGDRLITHDTQSTLEWLDLSQTSNQSVAAVQAQLTTTFAGWRLPSRAEVNALFSHMFPDVAFDPVGFSTWPGNEALMAQMAQFQQTFGITYGFSLSGGYQVNYSHGLYQNDSQATLGGDPVLLSGVFLIDGVAESSQIYDDQGGYDLNTQNAAYGVYLVRDATALPEEPVEPVIPVSAPLGFALLGLGLLGLAGWRRPGSTVIK